MLFGVGDLTEVPMPWGGDRERKCALPVCLPAACRLRLPACLPFALPSLGFPCVTNITPAMSRTCYFRRPGSFSDFLLATVYILDPCSSVNSAAFYSRNSCLALKRNVSHEVCFVCCWLAYPTIGVRGAACWVRASAFFTAAQLKRPSQSFVTTPPRS